ncbi:MAG: 3-hydroxyacyl-CoA dehydrogenase/enoyl-CoA hydratase family protein [Xanthomonadales bacterium]|nr:3-hydroxyacyl-CoA dehydrogenase/enoyl-CoA hydratase family protein [Xanthomonadales bacterium]
MNNKMNHVRRAAVLGAGVMGAQIAAHLVNSGIETVLFELAAKEGDPNALVNKAIAGLKKLKPSPLGFSQVTKLIIPANYDQHLHLLDDCDLVIEAIGERMDWKKDLYDKIENHIGENAILATNTSGLGIGELATVLPESLRHRFCGIHFFNPPRYMNLAEIIPHAGTDAWVLDALEAFSITTLGKGVVRAEDTPNFIANRIGMFSMLATMHHTKGFNLGFDTIDALTGPAIGRPKSATYRTADVVGLDTMGHTISTLTNTLPNDPWAKYYQKPEWLDYLIQKGDLGQKTRQGVFRKQGKVIEVLDGHHYRPADYSLPDEVKTILKIRDWGEKLAALRNSEAREAKFLWAMFRDLFHYCAFHLGKIADSARELDEAIRWGYGWKQGPFEIWQAAGWQQVCDWINADIDQGKSMANIALPAWASDGREGVHGIQGSWSAARGEYSPRSNLPVYSRQLQPQRLLGEPTEHGETIIETDASRLWTLDGKVAILSFKTKMNTVNDALVADMNTAIDTAEAKYTGLVIWQPKGPFCAGADLFGMATMVKEGRIDDLDAMIDGFQRVNLRLKYALVPTVAAVRGLALGGGAEILMHCARVVAAHESYIGLVEAGVGLLPAGGGTKELALRSRINTVAGDSSALLQQYFEQIAMGKVTASAHEAVKFGYLRPTDVVIMNTEETLFVAHQQVKAMAESGYRPPLRYIKHAVAGRTGIANFRAALVNMQAGNFISAHDYVVSERVATVLCGGEVDAESRVDEDWLIKLERDNFLELAQMPKTLERVAFMLKNGKPLRN